MSTPWKWGLSQPVRAAGMQAHLSNGSQLSRGSQTSLVYEFLSHSHFFMLPLGPQNTSPPTDEVVRVIQLLRSCPNPLTADWAHGTHKNYWLKDVDTNGLLHNLATLGTSFGTAMSTSCPALTDIQYLAFTMLTSSKRYDIIKRNVAPSNVETVNYLKTVVHRVSEHYQMFSSKIYNIYYEMTVGPWKFSESKASITFLNDWTTKI